MDFAEFKARLAGESMERKVWLFAMVLGHSRRHRVGLEMPRALEALQTTLSRIEQGEIAALEALEALLGEEYTTRESRRIQRALDGAAEHRQGPIGLRLERPAGPGAPPRDGADRVGLHRTQTMRALSRAAGHRSSFICPHLVLALGFEAVKAGKSVFFATRAEPVDSVREAERKLREGVKCLGRYSLLIVEEIGDLPLGSGGGHLFFQPVNACCERSAMVMTSNRGLGEWAEIFGDAVLATALLERLLHHAVVVPFEGDSYRLREHAALVPQTMRHRSS